MKTIRWGIIGYGDVCEVKSGPAFQKVPHSSLVAVMRRDRKLAEDFVRRHHVPRWYHQAHDLIHDQEVDAIYVATPPSSHRDYVIKCALAGKPVYVEKPMACTFAECQEMLTACREANMPLFVAYYRRRLPRFLKIKQLLDENAIGALRTVSIQQHQPARQLKMDAIPWRLNPQIAGAGLFMDLASHTLDVLDFLLGPIQAAQGFTHNFRKLSPAEDAVCAHWQFKNNVLATGIWCFASYQNLDHNEIIGDAGKIIFSTFGDSPITLMTNRGTETFSFSPEKHVQQPLIQTIVDELRGIGQCPSHGESAARTNAVMDAILNRIPTPHLC